MFVQLNCKIEIEKKDGKKLSFTAVNHCEIERSIYNLGSTAKIRIPASARLRSVEYGISESAQTAKQFDRGDKISISLGYDGKLENEFKGFIYRINYTTPLEIECEGYEYLLRRPAEVKVFKSTTLKELLQWATAGTEIKLTDNIADVPLTNYTIKTGKRMLDVVQDIKDECLLDAYFIDELLYVGLSYIPDYGEVKYSLGINTIKDNDLKYHNAEDVKLKVKAVWVKKDNTRIEVNVGDDDGQVRPLFLYNVTSKEDLEKRAAEEIKKYQYSGYEGKITTFLVPFSKPGMRAKITDTRYSEKDGTYYITSVKVTFSRQGARRVNEIGIKI